MRCAADDASQAAAAAVVAAIAAIAAAIALSEVTLETCHQTDWSAPI